MSKEKSDEYWQGYIQKQNESMQICEMCKYRKEFREMKNKLTDSTSNSIIRETIENEKINISGFECVAVEDLEKMLEGEKK